ncbi:MAG: peptidoglycan DD-metalloendopeptidase family protein [Muribaculaceae bacterium]|nr:peptidoglycan DD-metalloendopeptidase family protein [Muribaculaceae bacterium]
MKYFGKILLLLLIALVAATDVSAAKSVKNVKRQKQKTQKEIKETSNKIRQNTKQTNRQLNQLNLITAEIDEQGKNISNLTIQLNAINKNIIIIGDSISLYDKQLTSLKKNYAIAVNKMRSHATSMDKLLFVFSSESFRQALRRMRYLNEFSKWRERQSHAIQEMQQKLINKRTQLQSLLNNKNNTLVALNTNQKQLEGRKAKQSEVITKLKKEGASLSALLKEKEKKAKSLDKELNRLIAEEERKAAERARIAEQKRQEEARRKEELRIAEQKRKEKELAESPKIETPKTKDDNKKEDTKPVKPKDNSKDVAINVPTKPIVKEKPSSGYMMNNEERNISGSFESNKGNLLSPVNATYKVVKLFGRQRHPELRHVETDNGGIDIETAAGASARAVFGGKVSAVFQTDGFNTVVMLRHGNYLTVYVNLQQSFVSSGQEVKAGQSLGKIFSDPDDENRTILHFEIRKEKTKLNPQQWIK